MVGSHVLVGLSESYILSFFTYGLIVHFRNQVRWIWKFDELDYPIDGIDEVVRPNSFANAAPFCRMMYVKILTIV